MKMSDSFDLPLTSVDDTGYGDVVDKDRDIVLREIDYPTYVAHAVNCHDELVARLWLIVTGGHLQDGHTEELEVYLKSIGEWEDE